MIHQRIAASDLAKPRFEDRENGWCILTTNNRRTLRLAQSLSDAGIEAWSPRAVRKRKISKMHMGFREVEEPIMPGFVFARARHVSELAAVIALPNSPHPMFRIFQHGGRAPVISDIQIGSLHDAENKSKRARRKALRHSVAVGTMVQPTEGICAGLTGVVEEVKGKNAFVNFGGAHRFQIATWLLIDEESDAA